jgi:uncharacterized protein
VENDDRAAAFSKAMGEEAMNLLHAIDWLYAMSGFGVGLLVGMTGVGGGSLMTPVLILLFGIHPATAVGTDLLYAAATKTCGSIVHGFTGSIDWRVVARLAAGSVPMTVVTLFILSRVDLAGGPAAHFITFTLSLALLATAVALVFRAQLIEFYSRRVGELKPRRTAVLTVITGAMLGILVSISSVGAGAIGVTALILLYPRLPTARIVGSDIAHAVPLTLAAGVGHWMMGSIDTHILGSLLVGSIPGIVVGSYAAVRVPDAALRFTLAAVLAIVGGRLVL